MSKKLFASLTVALATALTSSVALAAPAAAAEAKTMVADRRGNDVDVLEQQRVGRGSGVLTFTPRRTRGADLAIVSTDPRIDLFRVMITYASGRTTTLRASGGRALDLPDSGRIASIRVQYANRGARFAAVQLVARDDHRGRDRFDRDGSHDHDDRDRDGRRGRFGR